MHRFIAVLALSACSYVAPMTATQLAAMDPLTADPSQIEVAVLIPPGLQATPESAKLEVKAASGAHQLEGSFSLAELGAGPGPIGVAGTKMVIFGMTPEDAAQMRAWQAEVAHWKTHGAEQQTGSLGIAIGACTVDAGPAPDAKGSVLIRLEKAKEFMPLIQAAPLSQLLGQKVIDAIRPCNNQN